MRLAYYANGDGVKTERWGLVALAPRYALASRLYAASWETEAGYWDPDGRGRRTQAAPRTEGDVAHIT